VSHPIADGHSGSPSNGPLQALDSEESSIHPKAEECTIMSDRKEQLKSLLERVEQERDELKMKFGLAKLEAKEEWQELQGKVERLRGRLKVLGEEADDAGEDVGTALEMLGEEIREGFDRIRKLF